MFKKKIKYNSKEVNKLQNGTTKEREEVTVLKLHQ